MIVLLLLVVKARAAVADHRENHSWAGSDMLQMPEISPSVPRVSGVVGSSMNS